MDAALESLLLQARGRACLVDSQPAEALEMFERAAVLHPSSSAAEDLFRVHFRVRDYGLARSVLQRFEKVFEPWKLPALIALLPGHGPASDEVMATFLPGTEALWPLLYKGLLHNGRGEIDACRRTLFRLLKELAWDHGLPRDIAVEVLLRSETRRCRVCRLRKPSEYLPQSDSPVCSGCWGALQKPWLTKVLTNLALSGLKRRDRKRVAPFVPLYSAKQVLSCLDEESLVFWRRAEELARERGRACVGSGELGIAFAEGPFKRSLFLDEFEQQHSLQHAESLPEEFAKDGSISEPLEWTLNVANWLHRLFSPYQPYHFDREGPIRARLLHGAFGVTQTDFPSIIGSSLSSIIGTSLSEPQVRLFEYLLERRPDSFFLHVVLASHYRRPFKMKDPRELEYEVWQIRNFPRAHRTAEHCLGNSPSQHRACVEAWAEALAANQDDPAVLAQAAYFFKWEYPALAEALLGQCAAKQPSRTRWIRDRLDANDRVMQTCWGELDSRELARESVEHWGNAELEGVYELERVALLALVAGLHQRAYEVVAELLEDLAGAESLTRQRAGATAQVVLGTLALEDGRVQEAERCFLDSLSWPPRDLLLRPVFLLACKLWRLGRHEIVAYYLAGCRNQWRAQESQEWYDLMAGHFPDFDSAMKELCGVSPR